MISIAILIVYIVLCLFVNFYRSILGELWEIKIQKIESGHYTFSTCYIQGAPRKKQHP